VLKTVLQIVPRVPGGLDGVGDYALTLAAKLRDQFGCRTVFATPDASSSTSVRDFEVRPLDRICDPIHEFDRILLHYVNYGYQKRGVPFGLLSIVRRTRRQHRGKLLTIFHELYASGPPSSSAFWLQPIQIHLTKSVARLSDECIVSSENFQQELLRLAPNARIHLHPTPSGLEEPTLSRQQIVHRDPHRWVVIGGTVLSERSLRSFARAIQWIPQSVAPRTLFVLGGNENPVTQSLLSELRIESDYRPRIAAADASEILETCSFAWFDYFRRSDVETSVILKSSAFAAACAHGVIPVLPHRGTPISIDSNRLAGPFFVEPNAREIPDELNRAEVAQKIYDWYRHHASTECLARGVAAALGLDRPSQ